MRKLTAVFLLILFIAGLAAPLGRLQRAHAQTSEPVWSAPVNLSRTGSTRDPAMVMDTDGVLHVVWQDSFADTMYTNNRSGTWAKPRALNFPFVTYTPRFVKDSRGYIGAFWVDAEQKLLYSYALAAQFEFPDSWNSAQELGTFVIAFDASIDEGGRPQVAFMTADTGSLEESGIYHRTSGGIGFAWETARQIYTSNYFRAVDTGTGHVQIAASRAGESDLVFIAWDDRALKRVFFSKSVDAGKTWSSPYLVDSPTENTPTADPFRLIVHTKGDVVDLIWQSGLQSGFDCTQYFQHSMDQGETWGARQIMLTDLVGCPQSNEMFTLADGLTMLMTTIQDEVYLLAWDGRNWSRPQAQGILYSFVDNDNYDTVNFRCRQVLLENGTDFYAAGCDTVGDGDIWLVNRVLGEVSQWFPPPNAWAEPVIITANQPFITGVETLADTGGRVHLFWNQPDEKEPQRTGVYYSQLNPEGWLPPVRVFSSPDNRAGMPSVIIDSLGRLSAVWGSTSSGEIYYSWADPAAANNPFEWAEPVSIPVLEKAASDPVLRMDPAGVLYVVYAIQLNESRGIYLVKSADSGVTWEAPRQVFDAAAAGWSLVQKPDLIIRPDGVLVATWEQVSLPGDVGVMGLYGARSLDQGAGWTEAEAVVDGSLSWSQLGTDSSGRLYRFWQTSLADASGLWYDQSDNGGESWALPVNLTRLGETVGTASLAHGGSSNLNLVQVLERENESGVYLVNLVNGNNGWGSSQSLELKNISMSGVHSLSAAVVNDRQLAVVYVYAEAGTAETPASMTLFYTARELDASVETQPVPTSTLEAAQVTETPAISEPAITETPAATQEPANPEVNPTDAPALENTPTPPVGVSLPGGAWGGLALGVSVAVVIVAITFGLALRRNLRKE